MELCKFGIDKDKIVAKSIYIVNQIIPIAIKHLGNEDYSILFLACQDSTEDGKYFNFVVKAKDEDDSNFLNSHSLNINNVTKNENRLKMYIEMTKTMHNENMFNCDFTMVVDKDHKKYFKTEAFRVLDDKSNIEALDLMITRDNYIKINLFFQRLLLHSNGAELVFGNMYYHNIEFITINHIKLDGATTDVNSNVICAHYTCGAGPTIFKFNIITPKLYNKKIRNFMRSSVYTDFYADDYVVTDMVYDSIEDCIYLIFLEFSTVNNHFKSTKALKFTKEFYDRSNFIDYEKIYEK